jgi:hypothetical protein
MRYLPESEYARSSFSSGASDRRVAGGGDDD